MSALAECRPNVPQDLAGLQTVGAVAKFLSLSRSKVYQLMEQGELPYVKIGKSRRLRWADVNRLVDQSVVSRS
jgi:excisionase family DNA binding protein